MRGGVGVVAAGEVAVVRGDDCGSSSSQLHLHFEIRQSLEREQARTGVDFALLDILAIPLANARSTRIRKHQASHSLKRANLAISLNRRANLLTPRCDRELALDLNPMIARLLRNTRTPAHILITRIRARADQGDFQLRRPVVLLHRRCKLADGRRQIRRERAVDMRLELAEVNLHDLVVLGAFIRLEVVLEGVCVLGDLRPLGGLQVGRHALVVREEGGGCSDFGAHVADGRHAGAGEGLDAGAHVLDDGARAALDGQDARDLEDDVCGGGVGYVSLISAPAQLNSAIRAARGGNTAKKPLSKPRKKERTLGRSPPTDLASQINTNDLGALQLPRDISHDIDSIRAADTARDHAESAGIGRVRVGADHEAAGEGVVLEDDLVDDTRPGLPEPDSVLRE